MMRNFARSHFEVADAAAAAVASFPAANALPTQGINMAANSRAMRRRRGLPPIRDSLGACCRNCLLRCRDARRTDKARGIAESLDHHRREVLGLAGHASA